MKKLLALLLIFVALFSFSACNKTENTNATETETAQEETIAPEIIESEDAAVKTEATGKEVYWATENKDSGDVWYHKKDCDMIKDKSPEVLPWEIINAIGMTACEKCNP